MPCIFCQIINKQMPATIVYENDDVLAFKDINPKAPTHILIVPKKHIESIAADGSEDAVKDLVKAAKEITQRKKIVGYKLVFHVGREGGQLVDHLHTHLLANGTN